MPQRYRTASDFTYSNAGHNKRANQVLSQGVTATHSSTLATLLRYAVFSADPGRLTSPDYDRRFELIAKLTNTPHLRNPIWQFDYGMLALQVRQIDEGLETFAELRRTRRFFEVPLERTVFLMKREKPEEREVGFMRVVRVDADGKGWAKLDTPHGFKESIPFNVSAFKRQTSAIQPGRTMTCFLRIRPSGLAPEPIERH